LTPTSRRPSTPRRTYSSGAISSASADGFNMSSDCESFQVSTEASKPSSSVVDRSIEWSRQTLSPGGFGPGSQDHWQGVF
jgi:hypothetical protein